MKRKKVYLLAAILILALAALTIGCINGENDILPTEIRINYPEIFLGPTGDSAKGKVSATILPENATNKNLLYRVDSKYAEFLTVDSFGNLTAQKLCEEKITVTVYSQANSDIKATLSVIIEEVKATRIVPDQSSIDLLVGGDTATIKSKFVPTHASLYTELSYIAINPASGKEIITVDSNGVVTPIAVGQATVMIRTEKDDEENYIEAAVIINVMYKPLKYAINSSQQLSDYKQIVGNYGAVSYTLLPLDDSCDPDPSIVWKIDNMPIKGKEGQKQLVYKPESLNVGQHIVSAILTDSSNRELIIEAGVPIEVYNDLRGIDISVISEQSEYRIGDTILFEINFVKDQYPPESYNWYIIDQNQKETYIGSSTDTKFRYTFQNQGYFIFSAKAVVKGVSGKVEKKTDIGYSVGIPVNRSVLNNIYVDGTVLEGKAAPIIIWDRLPYKTSYTVEIATVDNVEILSSNDSIQKTYFTENSCVIPSNIATLYDNFTIRVKSDGYDFSQEVKYESNEIVEEYYNCLEQEFLWHNAYITNMEELGTMVNYIINFRPLELMDRTPNQFTFDWYFGFQFDELDKTYEYPIMDPTDVDKYTPTMLNAFYCIIGAFNAYGDNHGFRLKIRGNTDEIVTATFIFDNELNEEFKSTGESNIEKQNFIKHYTDNSRSETNDDFAINYLDKEMEVNTSNQLYLAAINGYKPKFTNQTSSVYRVYQEAKRVLNRIISRDMTDEAKVHAIYDYLTLEIVYDYELLDKSGANQNISMYEGFYLEGVFLKNRAVCDGLAKAFALLCSMEGIKTYKISGITFNNVGHAWNGVVINGEYYLNDATWGNKKSGGIQEVQTHSYLNVSDKVIFGTRITYGKYPETADNNLNTYYNDTIDANNIYDHTIDSDEEFKAVIRYYIEIALSIEYDKEDLWIEISFGKLIVSSSNIIIKDRILEYLENNLPEILHGGLSAEIMMEDSNIRKVLLRLN